MSKETKRSIIYITAGIIAALAFAGNGRHWLTLWG